MSEAIGPYRVLERLGQGGMGVVHLVEDPRTGAVYALKTLRPGADAEERRRFRREAEAMARVDDHPSVLRVHSAGEHDGAPYLVMALARGGDLSARLRDGPLPPEEVARLGASLARGLAHVHARGVLHRDLKPSNVLFGDDGAPRLVDFGLARVAGGERLTQTGTIVGTPAYMAPEQANARSDLDERVDVYGLGALLYHALTGRPPFQGGSAWAVIERVLHAPPPPPRALVPHVPAGLEAVILRALAKSPDERFPSARALAEALEASIRAGPSSRARGRLTALGGASALVVVAALAAARWPAPPAPDEPARAEPTEAPRPDLAARRAEALSLLREEEPEQVLARAAGWGPPRPGDPRADVVAAAARLCDAEVPVAWQAAVAQVGSDASASRATATLHLLAGDLLKAIDEADILDQSIDKLRVAAAAAQRLGATRKTSGDHPLTIAAAIEVQRQVAERAQHLVTLTAAKGEASPDRSRRQTLVIQLLHAVADLEARSLSADALRLSACFPAIVSHHERDATWRLLDGIVEGDRAPALKARYPDVARSLPAMWLWGAGPLRVADDWPRAERRWDEVRRAAPQAFGADGRLAKGIEGWWMQPVIDAAKVRSDAAFLRAWRRRADPQDLAAAVAEALALVDLLANVDDELPRLHRARLHLLRGDTRAARAELDELRLEHRDDGATRRLGERLQVEAHLLAGELEAAKGLVRRLEDPANDDPTRWRHQAVLQAIEGRHDEADGALALAAQREPAVLFRDHQTYCPWWRVDETVKLLRVARARGWDPVRDGLFVRPGDG